MKREECEKLLMIILRDAWDTYKQYNPDGKYLTLAVIEDDKELYMSANNDCFEEDSEKPLDTHETEVKDDDSI